MHDEDIHTDICVPLVKAPPHEKNNNVVLVVDRSDVNKTHALNEL